MSNSILITQVTEPDNEGAKLTWFETPFGKLETAPTNADTLRTTNVFLFSRSLVDGSVWRGQTMHIVEDRLQIEVSGNYYGAWRLHPELLEWSDGPPHPDHLMLAVKEKEVQYV